MNREDWKLTIIMQAIMLIILFLNGFLLGVHLKTSEPSPEPVQFYSVVSFGAFSFDGMLTYYLYCPLTFHDNGTNSITSSNELQDFWNAHRDAQKTRDYGITLGCYKPSDFSNNERNLQDWKFVGFKE